MFARLGLGIAIVFIPLMVIAIIEYELMMF